MMNNTICNSNSFKNNELREELERLKKEYSILSAKFNTLQRNNMERKKELQAIYKLNALFENEQLSLTDILSETVRVIPGSWQYPEITCARIILDGQEFKTANFKVSAWKQAARIKSNNIAEGHIEVYYTEARPDEFDGPFLEEECELLNNISARIAAVIESRFQDKKFYSIFFDSPIAKFLIRLNGSDRISEVNDAFLNLTAYTRDELIGEHPSVIDFAIGNLQEAESRAFDYRNEGGNISANLTDKYGQNIPVLLSAGSIKICNTHYILVAVVDVSEIQELKRAEQETSRKLQGILNTMEDAFIQIDNQGTITYANRAAAELTGYANAEELIGLNVSAFHALEVDIENMRSNLRNFKLTDNRTILARRKDSSTFWVSVNSQFIYDAHGTIIGRQELARDMTEIVNYQDELIAAKEKAEQSDSLKTSFLLNLSHEIRTPMNGIVGFLELLKQNDLDDELKADFINIVNQSGKRLMDTINDIVEISKIEAGVSKLVVNTVNTTEVMGYFCDFFTLEANKKGLDLQIKQQITGDKAIIRTDKNKLEGILLNLIKNAIKFTCDGHIEIGNYIENDLLYFYVRDTGKGIPQNKQELIFESFVQEEMGNTRSYEGSGIGLSIVRGYLETLNGTISLESEVGKGSTFLFSIPYQPTISKREEPIMEASGDCSQSEKTILIVEDDDVSFYLWENILCDHLKIVRAINGKEAICLLKENSTISLVLMDIKLTGEMDGLEATRLIRKFNQDIPIVAQSAYIDNHDKIEAQRAGFNDYILKPFTSTIVKRIIGKYLGDS